MAALEIKQGLGYGGVTAIADQLDVTVAHVSQVMHGKRRSPRVERAIARKLGRKVRDVFPVVQSAA